MRTKLNIIQRIESLEISEKYDQKAEIKNLTNRIERLEKIIEDMGFYISRR